MIDLSKTLTTALLGLLLSLSQAHVQEQAQAAETPVEPRRYLFVGGGKAQDFEKKFDDRVEGVQIVYSWKSLEVAKDVYDFEKVKSDLRFLASKNKKLWMQLQDRFFDPKAKSVPDYLLTDPLFQGGLARQKDNPGEGLEQGSGWVTKQWNPNVRERFQRLIQKLAIEFDGKIYGINLPETAADIDIAAEQKAGFSCDAYFNGTIENINFTRNAFKTSHVLQYVNFWPCEWNNDRNYMSRFFSNAIDRKIALGGPDVIPNRKGQMKNSYPFFNQSKGKLPLVAFAVQEPTRTYTNPETGRKFTEEEFLKFADEYLGASIVFWSVE